MIRWACTEKVTGGRKILAPATISIRSICGGSTVILKWMTWTCPTCSRDFRRPNQWHSCESLDVAVHLRGKPPHVRETVEKLIEELREEGVIISPVKTAIQFRAGATFLSVKPKADHVDIEFQLGREVREFPVYRSLRVSKNRVVHMAVIEDPGDVDENLLSLLRESYEMIRGER